MELGGKPAIQVCGMSPAQAAAVIGSVPARLGRSAFRGPES